MPQPVTVYRWDDPGAPQIVERRPSELIAILKRCLVEGYGAKAPLGWSVLFEDAAAHKIIFQNSIAAGGSGGVLRVNTGNAGNAVDANTFFTPAKAATDIDTLFQPGYRHRSQSSTGWTRWVVIGTATAFYLVVSDLGRVAQNQTGRDVTGFFGDYISSLPNDAGRFIAFINNNGTSEASLDPGWDNSGFFQSFHAINVQNSQNGIRQSDGRLRIRNANGSEGARLYNVATFTGLNNHSSTPSPRFMGFLMPFLITLMGAQSYMDDNIRDDANQIAAGSILSPVYRGFMPGLLNEVFPRYSAQAWPVIDQIQGQQHFLVRSLANLASVWINMEEWP